MRTLAFVLLLAPEALLAQGSSNWEVGPTYLVREIDGHSHAVLGGTLYHDEPINVQIEYVSGIGRKPGGAAQFQAGLCLIDSKGDTVFVNGELLDPAAMRSDVADGTVENLTLTIESSRKLPAGDYLLCVRVSDAVVDTVWWKVVGLHIGSANMPKGKKAGKLGPYSSGALRYGRAALFTIDEPTGEWVEAEGRSLRRGPTLGIAMVDIYPVATDPMGFCHLTIQCEVVKESTGEVIYGYGRTAHSPGATGGVLDNAYIYFETKTLSSGDYKVAFRLFDELSLQWTEFTQTVSVLP